MELKERVYPSAFVEYNGDGGIHQYPEDTRTCCPLQSSCFISVRRTKDIQNNCWTTVKLDDDLVYENILVDLKKECQCKGKIVVDGKLGRMIRLEGDRESQVKGFLRRQGLTKMIEIQRNYYNENTRHLDMW